MAKKEEMRTKSPKKPGPPTQRYLDIAEIREDSVVLKDGTMRAVLLVSSINFALKNEDEQNAIVQAYMQFLNGLEYPIQIVIHSRKMNIDAYMQNLKNAERESSNEALRLQIIDYRNFVQELVTLGEIMQKKFYIIIPYDPVTDKKRGFWKRFATAFSPARILKLKHKEFDKRIDQLDRRVSLLQGGLTSMSLQSARLDTQSLIELYYTAYNPDTFDSQDLVDVEQLRVENVFE